MSDSARQTIALIGVALIAIAGVLFYIALRQPDIYKESGSVSVSQSVTQSETAKAQTSDNKSADTADSKPTSAKTTNSAVKYPLDLNKASAQELMTIDGLGEKRAYAIVEYREYLGSYSSVEQIMQIKGIDEEIYYQVAGYLTV